MRPGGYRCDYCGRDLPKNNRVKVRARYTSQPWPDGVRHLDYCIGCWNVMHQTKPGYAAPSAGKGE